MSDTKLCHRQELSSESSIWDDKATEVFLDECISKLDVLQTYLENSMTEGEKANKRPPELARHCISCACHAALSACPCSFL